MMPGSGKMKDLSGNDHNGEVMEEKEGRQGDPSPPSVDSDEILQILVTIPYGRKPQKTFQFLVEDTVWMAKEAVLLEFAQMNLSDPLNFGFYLPPHNGRAGKFLDEERPLKDYPMTKEQPFLEFRYKRKIFRGLNMEEKKLLKQNSKAQQRKFVETINTQGVEKVAALLEKGIDPNFQDEKTGETPLSYAVANPQAPELIKLLVGNGAHLDYRTADGYTALHRAAILGNSDALKSLLDLGASPNCKDGKGLTPLYHTVLEGSDSYCCELLLADYAQTGFVDHQGIQEIHQACRKGRVHHLEFLLYYGVDVNARTASGNTPLHICAISNDANCVELLLCRGADRSLVNYSNQSAYEVAIVAGNHEVADQIKTFRDSDVQPFTTSPRYTNRGKGGRVLAKVRSFENLLSEPSPFLKRAVSDSTMETKMLHRTSECRLSDNRLYGNKELLVDGESEESDSDESDSDDGKSTIRRRTFSNAGVGTPRAPAPLKSTAGGAAQLKSRLYASVPGRTFVAVVDYKPNAPGELALEKGEQVEVLYVGEQGFWEGRVGGRAGWFPSCCVQEIKKSKKNRPKSWFGPRKSSSLEVIEKISKFEKPVPRKVTLKRNDKGFGFQLRGANSHAARIEFVPTAQYPALQYIGEVDKGGVADKVGLKAGDFLLEVNGEDVSNSSHGHAVNIINKGGKTITMKVVTITPESVGPDLTIEDGVVKGTLRRERSNSVDKKQPPPKPPVRSPYTCLTMGRMTGAQLQLAREEFGQVPQEGTVMTLEKKEVTRKPSMKSIWAESAWKLRSTESMVCEGDSVPRIVSRRSEVVKGSIRNDRVKSMDVERHYNNNTNSGTIGLSKDDWSNSRGAHGSDLANDIRPIGANYPGYLTLPRKSSRKSSESSDDDPSRFGRNRLSSNSSVENGTTNGHRNSLPPDYEHTMENLRKMGRKSSFTYEHEQSSSVGANNSERTLPRCHTVPTKISDQDVIVEPYEERHRHHLASAPPPVHAAPTTPTTTTRMPEFRSSLVEGASCRTLPRSVSVPSQPLQPVVVPHLSSSFSENLIPQPSPRESEQEENLSAFAQSLASAVKRRESRVSQSGRDCEAIISERRKSILGPKSTGERKNVEATTPALGTEIKVTLNGDESPKGMPKLGGAEHLLQRRDSKGSDYFSLYTSSSTASLDSQCSKDSGIDTSPLGSVGDVPPDHASALAHAVAARAARLAAKEGKDGADGKKYGVAAETPVDGNRISVEEVSLVRPSALLQERKASEGVLSKSGSFGSCSNGVQSTLLPPPGNRDHNDNETRHSVGTKLPPPTKPKPSYEKRASAPAMAHREPRLEAVPEDVRYPTGYVGEGPPITTRERTFSEEDLATMYLDEVISEAAATIDSDLVSVKSLRVESPHNELVNGTQETNQGTLPNFSSSCTGLELDTDVVIPPPPLSDPSFEDDQYSSDGLPPPLMFSENLDVETFTLTQNSSALPPPPDDFLDEGFEETTKKSTPSISGAQDPPPPYSPPRSSVSNVPDALFGKSYADWNADDVSSWLEFINMAQYKATFLDNDIRGVHLPELTKEDLAELGVKKLGHRMTIDDAISKLCRTFTEV